MTTAIGVDEGAGVVDVYVEGYGDALLSPWDMSRDTRGVVALKFSTKFFHLDFCN
jgi:hypothetical protein